MNQIGNNLTVASTHILLRFLEEIVAENGHYGPNSRLLQWKRPNPGSPEGEPGFGSDLFS